VPSGNAPFIASVDQAPVRGGMSDDYTALHGK